MRIIVCIKQVPASTQNALNKETNTIIREGKAAIINPYDLYALEEALKLKREYGATIIVLSMGIMSVSRLLKKALALGADESILLSDRTFAGSDTLATANILSTAIKKINDFDLIICGKQATDGDTGQVGPGLAAKLAIPHTTNVKGIEEINKGSIVCQRSLEKGYERIKMTLPALITVNEEINQPGFSSLAGLFRAEKQTIKVWSARELSVDANKIGLQGSPTKVVRTFKPAHHKRNQIITGNPVDQVLELLKVLRENNISL